MVNVNKWDVVLRMMCKNFANMADIFIRFVNVTDLYLNGSSDSWPFRASFRSDKTE